MNGSVSDVMESNKKQKKRVQGLQNRKIAAGIPTIDPVTQLHSKSPFTPPSLRSPNYSCDLNDITLKV